MLALLAVPLNFVGYHLKVRAEEEYLERTHADKYEAYQAKTARYWPKLF